MSSIRPAKRTVVILVVLVLLTPLLVISALAVGLQPINPPSTPNIAGVASPSATSSTTVSVTSATSNTSTVSSKCQNATTYSGLDSFDPNLYNASDGSFPILSMQPGQTGVLCVAWQSVLKVSNPVNLTGTLGIGSYVTKSFTNGTVKHVFVPSKNFTITPSATPITIGGKAGPMDVVAYSIAASQASKGFYFLNINGLAPVGCDDEFRLAVGYTFTDANKSGDYFPLPPGMGACATEGGVLGPPMPPPGGIYSQISATSNLQVTDLACGSFLCDLNQPPG